MLFVALAVLVGTTAAVAGSLSPSSAPANTMYSLSDIYTLVTTGTTTESSDFSTPGSISASMYSLTQIVDAFASSTRDLVAGNIVDGATIFGIDGTAIVGAPSIIWEPSASSSHPRLCWNASELGLCFAGGEGQGGGLINNGGTVIGAVEYCDYLNSAGTALSATEQSIWRLPTLVEIVGRMQSNPSEFNYTSGRPYRTSDIDVNDYATYGANRGVYGVELYNDLAGFEVYPWNKAYNLVHTRCVK